MLQWQRETAHAILRTVAVIHRSLPPLIHQQRPSEDLYLSLPAEVSPYQFEPVYDAGEEPSSSSSSSSIPTEMEDFGVSRVGNTDW